MSEGEKVSAGAGAGAEAGATRSGREMVLVYSHAIWGAAITYQSVAMDI